MRCVVADGYLEEEEEKNKLDLKNTSITYKFILCISLICFDLITRKEERTECDDEDDDDADDDSGDRVDLCEDDCCN